MNINVRSISQNCQEVEFSEGGVKFESGLLDKSEAAELAEHLLQAASELLRGADRSGESDVIDFVIEKL